MFSYLILVWAYHYVDGANLAPPPQYTVCDNDVNNFCFLGLITLIPYCAAQSVTSIALRYLKDLLSLSVTIVGLPSL